MTGWVQVRRKSNGQEVSEIEEMKETIEGRRIAELKIKYPYLEADGGAVEEEVVV